MCFRHSNSPILYSQSHFYIEIMNISLPPQIGCWPLPGHPYENILAPPLIHSLIKEVLICYNPVFCILSFSFSLLFWKCLCPGTVLIGSCRLMTGPSWLVHSIPGTPYKPWCHFLWEGTLCCCEERIVGFGGCVCVLRWILTVKSDHCLFSEKNYRL